MLNNDSNKAVVLLSGGIDSTTTLAAAVDDGFSVFALTFDYGQRHRHELAAAKKIAESFRVVKQLMFKLDLGQIGGSALTANIKVPKNRPTSEIPSSIPITYVPARNTIFLSIALAWAETVGASTLCIGANAVDYSGYPDCRPEFIVAYQKMANLATKAGVEGKPIRVVAPLINMSKGEIIKRGMLLGVDYSMTLSCYDPDEMGRACGVCDSCAIRRRGFEEAEVLDPTHYSPSSLFQGKS